MEERFVNEWLAPADEGPIQGDFKVFDDGVKRAGGAHTADVPVLDDFDPIGGKHCCSRFAAGGIVKQTYADVVRSHATTGKFPAATGPETCRSAFSLLHWEQAASKDDVGAVPVNFGLRFERKSPTVGVARCKCHYPGSRTINSAYAFDVPQEVRRWHNDPTELYRSCGTVEPQRKKLLDEITRYIAKNAELLTTLSELRKNRNPQLLHRRCTYDAHSGPPCSQSDNPMV